MSDALAFLFTDIEGSTRRWVAFGEAMGEAVARHDALVRSAVGDNGGEVFSTAGDSFAVAFTSVDDAIAAAVAVQRALAAEDWGGSGWPRDPDRHSCRHCPTARR